MEHFMKLGQSLSFNPGLICLLKGYDMVAKKENDDDDLQDSSRLLGSYLDEVKFMYKHVCC